MKIETHTIANVSHRRGCADCPLVREKTGPILVCGHPDFDDPDVLDLIVTAEWRSASLPSACPLQNGPLTIQLEGQ